MSRLAPLASLTTILALALAFCASAAADVPIVSVGAASTSTQAGGHPDVLVRADLETRTSLKDDDCYCRAPNELIVNTPAGLIGTPTDIPRCAEADFAIGECPVDSQVGLTSVGIITDGWYGYQPLYNMEPREGQLALLATVAPFIATPIYISVTSRTESDYGLEFTTFGIPTLVDVLSIAQITWGVPASDAHDLLRFPFGGGVNSKTVLCTKGDPLPSLLAGQQTCASSSAAIHPPVPATTAETPFLANPTACSGPLSVDFEVVSYDLGVSRAEAGYPATTGCDQLSFDPSLSGAPTTPETESPSGININLTVPQALSPTATSRSSIRATTVTLPPGLTINSNAADGKLSCTAVEARFGSRDPAECPAYSKIGTLAIETTSLPGVLPGAIYLGEPLPGNRYRLFLAADGFSLHIKLVGSARLDPGTGQVVVSFDDLPQAPFQSFEFHVFGGERGLLATPTQCGTYPVKSEFFPWATGLPAQSATQFFTVDSGPGGRACPSSPRPFAPAVLAGVTDSTAGAHTTFSFELTREDGDQNLAGLRIATPRGFTASLAGIPYCSEATLAALAQSSYLGAAELVTPACPASLVGAAAASAGAGSRPVTLPGRVYLAGPYKGAPLSLAVVTPAVSGPYDLGNVVIRVALEVDPLDAHVTAISDPLPQILGGIPLRLRKVLVVLNRPGFALNPTDCSAAAVTTEVSGAEGGIVQRQNHFQAANCADLPYAPRLDLRLSGGVNRRGHPAIRATFTARSGDANTRNLSVTLPSGELLDQSHIGTVCTRVDYRREACPAGSLVGEAEVTTPLLDQPLRGSAHLRSSSHDLPDIAIALRGQVGFDLVLRVDSVNGRLRTRLQNGPDVPLTKFVLNFAGGSKGLLENSESLCGAGRRAAAAMVGQNGATLTTRRKLQVVCGKSSARRHHKAGRDA